MPSDVVQTARALASDVVCAEVVAAWSQRGIASILLKGPTVAEWLYPDRARGYVDIDLLVDPGRVLQAAGVLAELGFAPFDGHVSLHAHPWIRQRDGAEIDLHVTLWGPRRPAAQVWSELRAMTVPRRIGAVTVPALELPARALHVVLHGAQHAELAKPREDLRRALELVPFEVWRAAAALADRLWALPAMAEGLALEPAGQALARRLTLVRAAAFAERFGAPHAIGLARVIEAPGWRDRVELLARGVAHTRPWALFRTLGAVGRSAELRRP